MGEEVAKHLAFAREYGLLGDYQAMYNELFKAMKKVPDGEMIGWKYEYKKPDEPTREGFGSAPDPIEQIQSVMYDHNDTGLEQINVEPAGDTDD